MSLRRKEEFGTSGMVRRIFLMVALAVISQGAGWEFGFCSDEMSGVSVDIKNQAWVHGDKVYLKDVANLQGSNELLESIGGTYLAVSPSPGKSKTIPGSWISAKLRSAGEFHDDIEFNVPKYVRVERNYQMLEDELLQQHYIDYIAQGLRGADADFRVSRFRVSGNGPLTEGNIRIELTPQRRDGLVGNVRLNAIVWVNGNVEKHLTMTGWVDLFEDVVCVTSAIPRNATITNDDIELERRNVAKLSESILRVEAEAVGKRVKHSLRVGEVVTSGAIETPPIINKGDRVKIVVESSAILITTLGIAQGQGFYGDMIRVKNLTSNKDVIASVVDSSTVRAGF